MHLGRNDLVRFFLRIRNEQEWDEVRARGHRRWAWWNGGAGFGSTFLILILVLWLLDKDTNLTIPTQSPPILKVVVLAGALVMLCSFTGYIVADREWHRWADRSPDDPDERKMD